MPFAARTPYAVVVAAAVVSLAPVVPAAAQSEAALKSYFEGRRVTLRMDMPGTSDGVDVHADASRAIDDQDYRNNLKKYGAAIRAGDAVSVTLVKVKKDLIEFQLGGGGFGTFGDDTSTTVFIPLVEKSDREKFLEKRVKEEDDRERRRGLQHELDDLSDRRERENRRIMEERERQSEAKRERVADERLRGGSRFNLRYQGSVPAGLRPEEVMAALGAYVDFGTAAAMTAPPPLPAPLPAPPMPPPSQASGDISQLRKGMLRQDAERSFGRPVESSQRRDGATAVATLVFVVGEQRISADFVEDVLVRYTITSK
jgi:hypothetical protein